MRRTINQTSIDSIRPAREINGQPEHRPHSVSEIFTAALVRLMFAWAIAALIVAFCQALLVPQWLLPSSLIAIASVTISAAALMPGVLLGGDAERARNGASGLVGACVAAMAIRVAGTVALVVVCRYQMALSVQTIAMFVCGWYLLLTSIEVTLLARGAFEMNACSESTLG